MYWDEKRKHYSAKGGEKRFILGNQEIVHLISQDSYGNFSARLLWGCSWLIVDVVYCLKFCILMTDFLRNTFYFCVTFAFKYNVLIYNLQLSLWTCCSSFVGKSDYRPTDKYIFIFDLFYDSAEKPNNISILLAIWFAQTILNFTKMIPMSVTMKITEQSDSFIWASYQLFHLFILVWRKKYSYWSFFDDVLVVVWRENHFSKLLYT